MKSIPLENFAKGLTSEERKQCPVYEGTISYFPDALLALANHSLVANHKHNPNEPLHWDKSKSTDEKDSLIRHLIDCSKGEDYDDNGLQVLVAIAWRGLANLQREIDKLKEIPRIVDGGIYGATTYSPIGSPDMSPTYTGKPYY